MRTMSAALTTFLNSTRQLMAVDLFTFELKNGVTMRYCNAPIPMSFGGQTWLSAPAGLTRSKMRWATGVEVDSMDVVFQADPSIVVNGMTMLGSAVTGLFDNCRVTLERLFLQDWATPIDKLLLFQGNTAPAEILRQAVHLTVKSDLDRLNAMFPPNVYQSQCIHTLYGPGCTVKSSTYRVSATASTVSLDGAISSNLTQVDGYFQMGAIKFTSGANVGLTRSVKTHINKNIYPTKAFPYTIASGDTFTITPGCDHLRTGDCLNKYNNVINFKGFEYIPVPETAA